MPINQTPNTHDGKASDVVISLLPAPMHVTVAKVAIENQVPMVTASYVPWWFFIQTVFFCWGVGKSKMLENCLFFRDELN